MLKRIINYIKKGNSKEYQQISKLSKLPRYTKGSFSSCLGNFVFPDSASFVFMYKEIFQKKIYKNVREFKCKLVKNGMHVIQDLHVRPLIIIEHGNALACNNTACAYAISHRR